METQYYKHLNSTFTRVNQVKSRITIKYANHAAKRHATESHEHYSHIYRPPGVVSVPIGGSIPVAVGVICVPTEVIG